MAGFPGGPKWVTLALVSMFHDAELRPNLNCNHTAHLPKGEPINVGSYLDALGYVNVVCNTGTKNPLERAIWNIEQEPNGSRRNAVNRYLKYPKALVPIFDSLAENANLRIEFSLIIAEPHKPYYPLFGINFAPYH